MKLDRINREEAFRYLGYYKITPDEQVLSLADECEERLLKVIDGKYVYRYFPIETVKYGDDEAIAVSGTGLYLPGNSIRDHLAGCSAVVLFVCTIGEPVEKLLRTLSAESMTKAAIADCMASAATEQICDMVDVEIASKLSDKYLTWRFSPGYGDLPLDVQGEFLRTLEANKRIGISLTDGNLMVPCKSVSAIIGVSDAPIERKRQGCLACNMFDRCKFRKSGEHCGV